ncbi:hypothetical protein GGS23DRAFT_572820 [Durotheca rogersii]|uniref:uncharacterized protein n=1 Tax=Durotheca rogersii TaxID=419775 RepID=UPI0022204538|nr:uncharacterized protein GGS23DRAFT_572820 [Durotheca rogersii]KAI5862130.1 hypothetical protein GGS23DRAFT_572820 [Durotheca rogersii]
MCGVCYRLSCLHEGVCVVIDRQADSRAIIIIIILLLVTTILARFVLSFPVHPYLYPFRHTYVPTYVPTYMCALNRMECGTGARGERAAHQVFCLLSFLLFLLPRPTSSCSIVFSGMIFSLSLSNAYLVHTYIHAFSFFLPRLASPREGRPRASSSRL